MASIDSQDRPILTITEVTSAIKHCLENTFPNLWLQGEISNCKLHSSGHLYFSLKDAKAQIAAVMFKAKSANLKKIPKDGDKVIVNGSLNVYPPSGRYQIQVFEMRFAGLGDLLLQLEELKKKLHKKGWFKKEHKKKIPKLPRKIGVVTSPTGAAIQDILNILSRRFAGFHVILNPVRVQGDSAAKEIARAIEQFNETNLVDVMIVGRGGGSIEDLFAFNEEIVAEAIFQSRIPIIAAVGHETDHCIAEYVADMRAPTPSAAAEMVIAEKSHQIEKVQEFQKRLDHMIGNFLFHRKTRLKGVLKQPIIMNPYLLLGPWLQRLDDLRQNLDHSCQQMMKHKQALLLGQKKALMGLNPKMQLSHFKAKLCTIKNQLDSLVQNRLSFEKEKFKHMVFALKAIDPKNLLAKGYSIVFSENQEFVINSVNQVTKLSKLYVMLSDGKIASTVEKIFPST